MQEIETHGEFFARLDEAAAETADWLKRLPNDAVLLDVELQLDIMRRRTADEQVPTTLEKSRITVAGIVRDRFPFNRDRTVEELRYVELLSKLNYYYFCWPGSAPPDGVRV
jgi:hypothetical protein